METKPSICGLTIESTKFLTHSQGGLKIRRQQLPESTYQSATDCAHRLGTPSGNLSIKTFIYKKIVIGIIITQRPNSGGTF